MTRKRRPRVRLVRLRRSRARQPLTARPVSSPPYRFAMKNPRTGAYLDLRGDDSPNRLMQLGLPQFSTPEELAEWLQLSPGKLAWLTHRFCEHHRPEDVQGAHYHYRWLRKRSGGRRLIEAPKPTLKGVQTKILREMLDHVATHPAAHGFVPRRSILTNAQPHAGSRALLKLDLENFYPSISYARVVALFRSLGYCREAALWLARLTTSAIPSTMAFPDGASSVLWPYLRRHLPQGAPTSPALANLSAYSLDVRLNGLARSFGLRYTRYADDLTFSGSQRLIRALPVFIPLATTIVQQERFRVNRPKRRVLRNNQRQTVTGVVVNERPNVSRREYDRLKAILTNCVRNGPSSQNRGQHDDFAAHLRGRVAHVTQLNPARGQKLLELYQRIDWRR